MNDAEALKQVRAALEFDSLINLHRFPVKVSMSKDAVVLEGEVESVGAKKRALEHAAAIEGVRGVVDRLRVAPSERRGDGAIRDAFCALVGAQREFANCALRLRGNDGVRTMREVSGEWTCEIVVGVEDGVITLEGTVISLSHKRVLGVLAWWTPGCRDVLNTLELEPPERDNDEEIVEALSLVFEIDPHVDPALIRPRCENAVVTLEGYARTEQERRQAEFDAWALFGVDRVVNRIEVRT